MGAPLRFGSPKGGWPEFDKKGKTVKQEIVYLAGPMRGYDRFNFPAFDKAAAHLRSLGYEVRSPAEHDRENGFDETRNSLDGFDIKAAAKWDIAQVLEADLVVLLPGWVDSTGVKGELAVAAFAEVPVKEILCMKSLDLYDLSQDEIKHRVENDAFYRGYSEGQRAAERYLGDE